jgi:hypothetical protein
VFFRRDTSFRGAKGDNEEQPMKYAVFAALFILTLAGSAFAQEEGPVKPKPKPEVKPAEPAEPVPCGERTVCRQQYYLVEQQQAICIEELSLRKIDAARVKINDLEFDFKETKHTGIEIVMKPREVEQEVVCYKTEAVQSVDPCTGCPCTVYQKVPVTHKVTVTVYEPVREQREFVVRVPIVKEVERDMVVKQFVLDATEVPAIRKTFRVEHVEEQIQVPVYGVPPLCPARPGCPGPAAPCCIK